MARYHTERDSPRYYEEPLVSSSSAPRHSSHHAHVRAHSRSPPLNVSGLAPYDADGGSHAVPRFDNSLSTIAPAYGRSGYDLRESGALVRGAAHSVVEEPVIEHEHHHLHHHIDHGNVTERLAVSRPHRPGLGGREYSFDDLDVRERRYPNGVTVSTIHESRGEIPRERRHRHRHRHRTGRSVDRSTSRYFRSEADLTYDAAGYPRSRRGSVYDDYEEDDYTVVDVPAGSKRVQVKVAQSNAPGYEDILREREREITWRRNNGVRRSRGLGDELWTEITKDLVAREAIEELGYPFEETDFFYYIFEYLDREQISELVDITIDVRRRRVRDIEYETISNSGGRRNLRGLPYEDDTRTEVIIENGRSAERRRRRYYY